MAHHQSIYGRPSVTRGVCQTCVAVAALGQGESSRVSHEWVDDILRWYNSYSLTHSPYLQLRLFALELHDLHLEVDDDRREELAAELVGDEPADEARLAHAAVPDD